VTSTAPPTRPASPHSFIEPGLRAFRRLPIRWRLAGTSALLTLVILCGFAIAVGALTTRRIQSDFDHQIAASAAYLGDNISVTVTPQGAKEVMRIAPNLDVYAGAGHGAIRVLDLGGSVLESTKGAPDLGSPFLGRTVEVNGYRVENREVQLNSGGAVGAVYVQYGRPLSDLQNTLSRVQLFLIFGVLGGTALALLAGVMIARGAMAPIAALTAASREIALTRDARRQVPKPEADDEVAELALTLDGMLRSLADARSETEVMLARQREFVADASHELRTPLTSVLANLELLAESLHGENAEAAHSALRSSRRMRRLVEDLLLLARADVGREARRVPTDLAQVAIEAAAELGPVAEGHHLILDAAPAPVLGARDELHRVAINLMENAVRHTPPGTEVRVSTRVTTAGEAELTVTDDGPGIDPEMVPRLFERFVRGSGDRGGSFGIGLAIVRAVAESHGGSASLGEAPGGRGTSFVVRIPALAADQAAEVPADLVGSGRPGAGA
jgi:two-component system OmpR family sensor kinase